MDEDQFRAVYREINAKRCVKELKVQAGGTSGCQNTLTLPISRMANSLRVLSTTKAARNAANNPILGDKWIVFLSFSTSITAIAS